LRRRILNTDAKGNPRLTQFLTNAGGFLGRIFSAGRALHGGSSGSNRF
jgi:hypothetical protein